MNAIRHAVVAMLREHGPMTTTTLAKRLDERIVAVECHVVALRRQGVVTSSRARPRLHRLASPPDVAALRQERDDLAAELVEIADLVGANDDDEVVEVVRARLGRAA